jgi:HK97 family phage major capsid protein
VGGLVIIWRRVVSCLTLPAGSLSIAFGNFQLAYVIVDKAGIRFLRDPLTDKRNLLFYAYRRCGGSLANSEAIKLVKTGTS